MKKYCLVVCLLITMLLGGTTPIAAQDALDAIYLPVGTLTIAAPRGVEAKRSPVLFPHSTHFDYTCKSCHHTWDGLGAVQGCMAAGCHDQGTSVKGDEKEQTDKIRYFKEAYHRACLGCHRTLQVERKERETAVSLLKEPLPKAGPTGCVVCHPR